MSTYINHLDDSKVTTLGSEISFNENAVNKKLLVNRNDVMMVLFALDKHVNIAKHSNPGDALVQIIEGIADITIDETVYRVQSGETIVLPANVPHALHATEQFKMLLTVIKPKN